MPKSTSQLTAFENHFPANSISDLVLLHNGREQCTPGQENAPCVLDHYLLNLVVGGQGTLYINQSCYHLSAGMGFFVAPGALYSCRADQDDPWEYLWIGFSGASVSKLMYNSSLMHISPIYISSEWKQLYEYMAGSITAVRHGNPGSLAYCQGMLLLIISHLLNQMPLFQEPRDLTKLSNIQEEYIRKSIAYIQNHLDTFFTVDDVARELGLNRSYFSRLFTRISGISPSAFIENYRLDNAWHILRHTNIPIAKISRSVGYHDPAYFSRRFQQRYGIPPSQVRFEGNHMD